MKISKNYSQVVLHIMSFKLHESKNRDLYSVVYCILKHIGSARFVSIKWLLKLSEAKLMMFLNFVPINRLFRLNGIPNNRNLLYRVIMVTNSEG